MADVNSFVEEHLNLLRLEREAEINESTASCESADTTALEKKGVCLAKLLVKSRRTGLYGRSLLTFGKGKTNKNVQETALPAHRITPGDIIGLSYSNSEGNVSELSSGIVTRVSSCTIVVAFDSLDSDYFDDDALVRLTRLANDITHKRMKRALESLCNLSPFPCSHLVDVLFGAIPIGEPLNLSGLVGQAGDNVFKRDLYFNPSLNHSQRMAVQFALTRKEVGIIHGPPGTGKTTTVVEVIVQAVKKCHLKVLACAPSNIAVDNIVERLAVQKIKAVRLGHPARVLETIHGYSLDAILDSSDGTAIVKDVRKDIDNAQTKLKSCRNRGERTRLRSEMKTLRRELREREEKALKQILQNAEVILATNVSASDDGPLKHLPKDYFDLVVIDEAAQSLEAACWIPLLWAPRCILAGDHQQLPPTIISRDAAKKGLEKTLMERVIELLGESAVHMLTTQYRMNEKIMTWSSEQLYSGKLTADSSVAQHLLCDLPEVSNTEVTSLPLLLIDTAGCDLYELRTPEEESKGNEGEAEIVAHHVEALISSGLRHKDIGVITPYNLQVELLRSRLSTKYPALEIKSVDGFQGREKEAIIISLVRSNDKGEIGFLAENRRTNVAVTRARRHLTVVGDSSTVSRDSFLKTLIDYVNDHGEVWSAEQYRSELTGDCMLSLVNRRTEATMGDKLKSKHKSKPKKDDQSGSKNKGQSTSKGDRQRNVNETSNRRYGDSRMIRDNRVNKDEAVINKDTEEKRNKLEREINLFVQDPKKLELEFSSTLTSEERFMVHSIAEELKLGHVSKGTGDERFIAVFKPKRTCNGTSVNNSVGDGAAAVPNYVEEKPKDKVAACCHCEKSIPSCNLALHEARCEREQACKKTTCSEEAKRVDKSQKSSKKNGKLSKQKILENKFQESGTKEDDSFNELLEEFVRKDSQCGFLKCEKSILTVGQTCRYCKVCFCLGHHIPEVHGCSQAAKTSARQNFTAMASGNQKQQSNKAAVKKAHLQKKLGSKLKGLEEKRGRKTKQKEEQKK